MKNPELTNSVHLKSGNNSAYVRNEESRIMLAHVGNEGHASNFALRSVYKH